MNTENEKDIDLEDEDNVEYDTVQLVDEDGNEMNFEIVDCAELDGHEYMALSPLLEDPEQLLEADGQLVFLRVAEDSEDGEQYLDPIMDDEEYNKVEEIFRERLGDEFDFVDGEE